MLLLPEDITEVEWKRPQEIAGGDAAFVTSGITRFDVIQGRLANCWFIGVLANLADTKNKDATVLEKLFDEHQSIDNENAEFTFYFRRNGEWEEVTVDDSLPCKPESETLLFCKSEDPAEFWPSLLEKAYAQFKGSYADLEWDYAVTALNELTDDDWEKMREFADMYVPICHSIDCCGIVLTSTIRDPDNILPEVNLVARHVYSITGHKVDETFGQCLRIRNPWGSHEYNGPEAHLDNEKEDGEFYISWDNFCRYFKNITWKMSHRNKYQKWLEET